MHVYLDDQTTDLAAPSLGGLIDAARQQLAEGGRVVVEVHVDGQALGQEQLAALQAEPLNEQQEVRLFSADPKQLAVETLQQVDERLTDAGVAQSEAADLLQQDQPGPAFRKVAASVEAWLQVQQAVLHSAMLLGIQLDDLQINGQPAHTLTSLALERLQELKAHLQANDTVALADALAYEWPDLTRQWHQLIDTLIKRIDQP